MGFLRILLVCLTFVIYFVSCDVIILDPQPLGPEAPICTSYSGLCHLAYNLTDLNSYQVWHSAQEICRCPNNQECETDWFSSSRSVTKVFRNAGQEVEVKISYCELEQPDTVCRQDEVAMTTRGRGAFTFEIVSDFRCRCYRSLYAHRSWREGDYDYIEYSCGKPRCGMNRLPSSECERVTWNGASDMFINDYICRCRRKEECISDGTLPTEDQPVISRSCQPLPYQPRRRRQHGNRN
ncbi:hypothetical protein MAR_033131 [Mya arenaria]|uniref:Uncharacterized protein n=1 Tax=Mya arenaria TaxID=6604 RepID=A0ABY7GAV0_MYAAR|nr:uncharacterized protein LOC128224827 [Mya arenaria]WAR30589.1 hypothetical protein MAR_033131 [Mya arenaria]